MQYRLSSLLLTLFSYAFSASWAFAELWSGLEQGDFGIGYTKVSLVDETRPVDSDPESEASRVLQLSIWYPAESSLAPTAPMRVRDYLSSNSAGTDPLAGSDPAEPGDRLLRSMTEFPLRDVAPHAIQQALLLEGRARPRLPAASGRFPLVIIVPGNHDPAWRHFVLAEYLASHGYVIAAFPSAIRRTRSEFAMSITMEAFRDQLLDTVFTLDYMTAEYAGVDASRVMLFGFSMGGNTGGLNLLRSAQIDGFICFDCGIGSTWGTGSLNARLQSTFPGAVDRPLAFLHISEGGERNDDSFIDRFVRAHAYHAIIEGARHFDFTSLGAIAGEVAGLEHERWLSPGDAARRVHRASVTAARWFLDAHLKEDEEGVAHLRSTSARDTLHFHRIVRPGDDDSS